MKKVIISVIATATLLASTTAFAASKFTDVPETYWASTAINDMTDKGVLKGYADGTFKPGNPVSKAEFAHMFHALKPSVTSGSAPATFADTKGHWASTDFKALFGEGNAWLVADHFDDKGNIFLAPDKQLTRWDVAILLGILTPGIDATSDKNGTVTVSASEMLDTIRQFSDIKIRQITASDNPSMTSQVILTDKFDGGETFASDLDNVKAAYLYSVIKKGVMVGSDGKFRPSAKVTRAEAVTTLQRIESLR